MRGIFLFILHIHIIMYDPKYYQNNRDKIRAQNKLWREARIKNGLCIACNNVISVNSVCLCDYHLLKNKERHSKFSVKTGRKRYHISLTEQEYEKICKYLQELRASQK